MCDALNTIRSYEQSKVIYDGFIRTCDELIFLLPIITKEEFDELSNLFKVCQIYVGKDKRQYFVFEENGKKYRVENRMIKKAYDEEYDVLEEYYVEPVNIVRGQNDFEKVLKNLYRKYSRKCINF